MRIIEFIIFEIFGVTLTKIAVHQKLAAPTISITSIFSYVKVDKEDVILFREFCEKFVNADGIMVLKIISGHSSEIFAQEILIALWKKFRYVSFAFL